MEGHLQDGTCDIMRRPKEDRTVRCKPFGNLEMFSWAGEYQPKVLDSGAH